MYTSQWYHHYIPGMHTVIITLPVSHAVTIMITLQHLQSLSSLSWEQKQSLCHSHGIPTTHTVSGTITASWEHIQPHCHSILIAHTVTVMTIVPEAHSHKITILGAYTFPLPQSLSLKHTRSPMLQSHDLKSPGRAHS